MNAAVPSGNDPTLAPVASEQHSRTASVKGWRGTLSDLADIAEQARSELGSPALFEIAIAERTGRRILFRDAESFREAIRAGIDAADVETIVMSGSHRIPHDAENEYLAVAIHGIGAAWSPYSDGIVIDAQALRASRAAGMVDVLEKLIRRKVDPQYRDTPSRWPFRGPPDPTVILENMSGERRPGPSVSHRLWNATKSQLPGIVAGIVIAVVAGVILRALG